SPPFCRNPYKTKGLARKNPIRPPKTKNLLPSPPTKTRRSLERTEAGSSPLPEQKLLLPQFLDLVAQSRRFLELELLGRLAHLALQPGDVRVQLGLRGELRNPGNLLLLHIAVLGLQDLRQAHIHVADDRLRRDTVLLVVGALDGSAPVGLVDGPPHRVG